MKQKSRIAWLNEGNSNTRFFHMAIKERRAWNMIDIFLHNSGVKVIHYDGIQ